MDSTSTHGILIEEREELMVLPSEDHTRPTIKKSHLSKPHVTTTTTIDDNGSEPFLRKASSPRVKSPPLSVSFSGWRLPNKKFKSWFLKMSSLHKPIWIQSGIFEAIKASTHTIRRSPSLILSLSLKWNPKSKTFVFPWGEATITLEDVTLLLGFSVRGSSVNTPPEMKDSVLRLERRRKESVKQASWISPSFEEDDQMEHEAFLAFWLSNFVFPHKQGCSVSKGVFNIAVRLARGEMIALAPAVLASVYRDLGKVSAYASSTNNVDVKSLFKLVQVWVWERFKSLGPRPGVIPSGEPRIARWSGLRQRDNVMRPFLVDDFDWRPYTKPLRNWNPPRFYNEKAKSDDDEFARFVKVSKLDGLGVMEDYYPNRVAMQFGLAQDPTNHHRSSFREKEACEKDYSRPIDGSNKHIASRLTTASVSAAKYRDWWMKSVKEPAETFNASNTGDDDDDDDDVPLKVLPLSEVFQKLGDGKKKAEELINKKRKQASEDDMDCCETQDEEEDDDNITISQRIKCRKKCGDVKDTGDQRTSTEEDCNVPDLPQKLACGGEQNSSDPIVASGAVDEMEEEDDNITIAHIIKHRKKFDNIENTAGGECAYGGLEVDYNVPSLPQKLAGGGDKSVAVPSEKKNDSDPLVVVSNDGIAEKEEEEEVNVFVVDDEERLNQRELGTDELAMKLEARMLKVEKTLEKIRQWKMMGKDQTKTPASSA